ncbi:transcription termination/antitermination protein NusG [Pseudosulfitobacter pseudonitzschiae]
MNPIHSQAEPYRLCRCRKTGFFSIGGKFPRQNNQIPSGFQNGADMVKISDSFWFVAQLRPQGLERARAHLQRQGIEVFNPEMLAVAKRAGVQRQSRKPLFPGYIFVNFDPAVPGWSAINSTRGVARLILSDPRRPQPLPSALIAGLKQRCDKSDLLAPSIDLDIGDRIRVLAGPFADLVTTIDTLAGPERIGILIDLMGRKVKTSLPRDQVEKLY